VKLKGNKVGVKESNVDDCLEVSKKHEDIKAEESSGEKIHRHDTFRRHITPWEVRNAIESEDPHPLILRSDFLRSESNLYYKIHKHGSIIGVLLPTCENMWGIINTYTYTYIYRHIHTSYYYHINIHAFILLYEIIIILNMLLGVLIFLRFYSIVGHAGVGHAILMSSFCFVNAIFASTSLSAMATSGGAVACNITISI
jgi:hypothetical protein